MYVQNDTLFLADIFENFWNIYLKIYKLDPVKFLSAPALAWQAALAHYQYVIKVEKGIRSGICHSVYWYTKAKNKYMKDYNKNKESLYIQYWDVSNLYSWIISQKLSVSNFEWMENTCQFNKDSIENYNEGSDEGYFLEVNVQYFEKLHELHNDLPFLPERMNIE